MPILGMPSDQDRNPGNPPGLSDLRRHQRAHPVVTTALLLSTLPPVVALMIGLGRLLKHLAPEPALWQIVLALPLFILGVAIGVLLGGLVFLLIAKEFVPRDVLEPHYVYPGVPVASSLSARLFRWAYRNAPSAGGGAR